jgi:hypothetical protein
LELWKVNELAAMLYTLGMSCWQGTHRQMLLFRN